MKENFKTQVGKKLILNFFLIENIQTRQNIPLRERLFFFDMTVTVLRDALLPFSSGERGVRTEFQKMLQRKG